MGSAMKEKGVLKLVHPGRHIVYHRQPITAAEVMKRNPRHCVTRPDVFKYPWIVVKPESVLMPGKVFFIVPNLTIHGLLKDRGFFNQASQNLSPNCHLHNSLKSCAGRTPKHLFGNISQTDLESNIYKNTIKSVDLFSDLALSEFKNCDQEIECQKQVRKLKSCIRKVDSIRRWVKLRVTFDLTTKTTEIDSHANSRSSISL